MKSVFILWHTREDDPYGENAKLIGVYVSRDEAHAAIERVKHAPGFAEYVQGFSIDEYELGKDHWSEGFGFGSGQSTR